MVYKIIHGKNEVCLEAPIKAKFNFKKLFLDIQKNLAKGE
ncbi:hypothetical protein NIES298_12220 [Microcystis aeruginosa NIES-298]|jgi:hypothetical protein|nr:hypothetical protein BFG60_0298 [Microcystis aeruginosa NIES-98]GBE96973.1 hypothetical protein NIES298_12220 [Microcystis aeruginosa NIES-298]